jgi:hypothetical protein
MGERCVLPSIYKGAEGTTICHWQENFSKSFLMANEYGAEAY